jgi:hypothetical protein
VQLVLVISSPLVVLWRREVQEVWYVFILLRLYAEADIITQVLGYIIVGSMLLVTMQALGEMAVLFPVNGAFYTYIVRFVDPSL